MKPDTNHVSTGKTGQTFWMRLTEPHVSIPEAERQRVRLTAALSLALMLTSAAAVPGQFLLGSLTSDVWTVLAATASLAAAYALSRSPRAGLAVWFVLFPILSAPLIISVANENPLPLAALCLTALTASLIASPRLTAFFYLLTLSVPAAFGAWFPDTPLDSVVMNTFIIGSVGALALLTANLRRRDQKQIEEQSTSLARSERKYRSLVDHALTGVYQTNLKGNLLFANPELSRMLNYDPHTDLRGMQVASRYKNPQDRARLLELLKRDGRVRNFETDLLTSDNQARTVLMSALLEGEIIVGMIQDITERKRADETLRESEQRYQHVLDNMLEGCQIIGFDWRYLYVNEAVAAQGRQTREVLIGHTMMEIYPGIEDTGVFAVLRHCMEDRLPRRIETEFVFPDGSKGWFDLSIQPVPEGIFILSMEITERKRAEAERLDRIAAEQASRAKNEFLSRMSHELRTPLNVILGFAQLLKMDKLNPSQLRGVEQIYRSGRFLLDLVNEVLDIARIEAGRMTISPEAVRLDEAVNDVVELIRPMLASRRLSLSLSLPSAADVFVLADRQRLKQVLLNLLSNAVKYNREGGGIAVSANLTIDGQVRLQVRDGGEGIPPEKMDRLFVPFDRLDSATVEGTGLGLTLSKGLIEAMGGRIGAESRAGEGSTFWIELKLATEKLMEVIMAEVEENLSEFMRQGRGLVLYVEDNLANVNLVEAIMERLPGVKLITAMQGRLAMSLAKEHQPDLILLDLHLPDIYGAEVLRWLKEEPATQGIPVVIISADVMAARAEDLLAQGAHAYLAKPIDVKEFLSLVEEHLSPPKAAKKGRGRKGESG